MPDHTDTSRTRTLVLPSGRTVVVNYVDHVRPADPELDLHVCGTCSSELVHPLDWEPAGSCHWQVTLRCPNCGWEGTGVFDEATVTRFDQTLDRASELMVADLCALELANMHDFADRFVAALHAGHVLPEDF
jgi:hypothetical protein